MGNTASKLRLCLKRKLVYERSVCDTIIFDITSGVTTQIESLQRFTFRCPVEELQKSPYSQVLRQNDRKFVDHLTPVEWQIGTTNWLSKVTNDCHRAKFWDQKRRQLPSAISRIVCLNIWCNLIIKHSIRRKQLSFVRYSVIFTLC